LVINKCVTAVILSNFSGHYLRNRSTLDIGVLGFIGVLYHMEHSSEVWHIPPGTPLLATIPVIISHSQPELLFLTIPYLHQFTLEHTVLCEFILTSSVFNVVLYYLVHLASWAVPRALGVRHLHRLW